MLSMGMSFDDTIIMCTHRSAPVDQGTQYFYKPMHIDVSVYVSTSHVFVLMRIVSSGEFQTNANLWTIA